MLVFPNKSQRYGSFKLHAREREKEKEREGEREVILSYPFKENFIGIQLNKLWRLKTMISTWVKELSQTLLRQGHVLTCPDASIGLNAFTASRSAAGPSELVMQEMTEEQLRQVS